MSNYNESDKTSPESPSEPTVVPARRAPSWWTVGVLVLLCMLVYDHILQPALEPCGWLDIALRRSGCFQVLEMHEVLEGYGYSVGFAFSDNGTALASSSLLYGAIEKKGGTQLRTSVEWWQVSDGDFTPLLGWTTGNIQSMALSPNGKMVALATWNGIILWEIPPQQAWSSEVLAPVRAFDIAFSPDGTLLASHHDTQVQLWRVADRTLQQTFPAQDGGSLSNMAFSPDGTLLAVGGNNGVTLWTVTDGTVQRVLPEGYSSIAFSRDGVILATVANANEIYLWRVLDGVLLHKLKGHPTTISSIALSHNGETLASVSGYEMRLWRVEDGELLRTWDLEADAVAFSSDGVLAVKMEGGMVALYRLTEE